MRKVWCGSFLFAGLMLAQQHSAPDIVPGRLLVRHRGGVTSDAVSRLLNRHGAKLRAHLQRAAVSVIDVPPEAVEATEASLVESGEFDIVEHDYYAYTGAAPNDPSYPSQWHLAKIQAASAWNITTGASSVLMAVIDSGVDSTHPDLAGRLVPGWNFVNNSSDVSDVLGHGTAVAGVMAAASNNLLGVAGVTWQNPIMPLVVVNSSNVAYYSNIANAIYYAVDHGARILNISIGGTAPSSVLQNAADYAWSKGAVIFASAMNNSSSTPNYPAACTNVVAVSATDSNDNLAGFSNYGSWIVLSAPGVSILTTSRGGGSGYWSGTSFASPTAAAVGALVLSAKPTLTSTALVSTLKQNSDDLGAAGFDASFGWGRINAYRAVAAVASSSSVAVSITPASVALASGQTQAFTAAVTGTTDTAVTWSLSPAIGTVSSTGVYTAPAAITSTQTVSVTATSVADSARFATATVTLTPPAAISKLAFSPAVITGSLVGKGTVYLTAPAPAAGVNVALTSSNAGVAAVSSFMIPPGASYGSFNIGTMPVTASTSIAISASVGGPPVSANLTVIPAALSSLSLSPVTIAGGSTTSSNSLTLTGNAPAGGVAVNLASSDPAAAVPVSVTVPEGSKTVRFSISTVSVLANASATITASLAGVSKSAALTITPVALSLVSLVPVTIAGGNSTSSNAIYLTGPAPAGGLVVSLSSSDPAARVPASITIPAGSNFVKLIINTAPVVSNVSATITASLAGISKSAVLTITPPVLSSLYLSPATVAGGNTAVANTLMLTGPAPAGGVVVTLSSSNPVAAVPISVAVAAGSKTATFAVATAAVAANASATITASLAGISKSAVLTVTP